MQIGWIGTGLMGAPMVMRLLEAGFSVSAWNRTPAKLAPLVARGARAAADPAAAATGVDVLFTMLEAGPAVREVLFDRGAAAALAPGSTVIDMSSIAPAFAREHAARLAERGVGHLDAPVSGGTVGAAGGTLAIMAGGASEAFAAALPLFAPLGRATHVGPAGAGQVAKLVNQIIVAINLGAVAEGLVLAAGAGADPAAVRDAIRGGFAESRILAEHGQRMVDRNFTPGGTVKNQVKDLDAAAALAAECALDLPLLATVRDLFIRLRDDDGAGLDHSALLLQIERGKRA